MCALFFALSRSAALPAATFAAETAGAPTPDLAAAEAAFTEGVKAREANDLATYRARIERAAELLPDPTRLLYRLAGARLLTGDRAGALEALGRQIDAGLFRDPRKDADFAPLLADPAFVGLMSRGEKLSEPIVKSSPAFELPERDLLVEGIAYDPDSKAFYLSSVRQRKVLKRGPDGKWTTLAAFGEGAASPLGIAWDAGRKRLWLATAGLPQGGAAATALDRGNLMALELGGETVKALAFGALEEGHSTNDLALGADGSVWFSDPGGHAVGRLDAAGKLSRFGADGGMRSPGGVALSADGKRLYVADWTNGLATIEIATGAFSWIRPPAGATVLGIDGLIRDGDALIAIQNGVNPPRITRFKLSADGLSLTGAELLERAVPEWDEPTLGVIVDRELWYVSASQWPRYDEDGKPAADLATLPPSRVRRLPLR